MDNNNKGTKKNYDCRPKRSNPALLRANNGISSGPRVPICVYLPTNRRLAPCGGIHTAIIFATLFSATENEEHWRWDKPCGTVLPPTINDVRSAQSLGLEQPAC